MHSPVASIDAHRIRTAVDAIIRDLNAGIAKELVASRGVQRIKNILSDLAGEAITERPRQRTGRENEYIVRRLAEGAVPEQIAAELAPEQENLRETLERRARRIRGKNLRTLSGTMKTNPVMEKS